MSEPASKTPHQGLRIERMFAYLAIDPDEDVEGVAGMATGSGFMPLVGADMLMMEKLRPMAQMIARQANTKVTLAVFSHREDREVFDES